MLTLMSPEQRVPANHPLRSIKRLATETLNRMSATFDAMYSEVGRPSIPPERLLKATLLMAFYTVRSERLFCEQLGYNLLFRWFLDMDTWSGPHRLDQDSAPITCIPTGGLALHQPSFPAAEMTAGPNSTTTASAPGGVEGGAGGD